MGATLNVSTSVFPAESFLPCLEWMSRLGVPGVEVSIAHARQLSESAGARAAARDASDRLGVRLRSLHAWTSLDGIMDVCPVAAEIGASLIVVHCPHESLVADFDGRVARAREYVDWCRMRSIVATVENSSRQPVRPFATLFESVPELAMTLDVKHAYKPDLLGLTHADYLRVLGGRAANFHVSGTRRVPHPSLGDGTPPGQDAIDWRALAAELAAQAYSGLITIETSLPLPGEMTAEELEQAYADMPATRFGGTTVSERLAAYAVAYYRREFATILKE